ncbi:MAG: hypothetical protein ACK55I_22905, partial [bacterium]
VVGVDPTRPGPCGECNRRERRLPNRVGRGAGTPGSQEQAQIGAVHEAIEVEIAGTRRARAVPRAKQHAQVGAIDGPTAREVARALGKRGISTQERRRNGGSSDGMEWPHGQGRVAHDRSHATRMG